LAGVDGQLKTTRRYPDPSETAAFVRGKNNIAINDLAGKFCFDQGMMGEAAKSVDVFAIPPQRHGPGRAQERPVPLRPAIHGDGGAAQVVIRQQSEKFCRGSGGTAPEGWNRAELLWNFNIRARRRPL